MKVKKRIGKRFDTKEIIEIGYADGKIRYVRPSEDSCLSTEEEQLPWISPGWIDLQVNGYAGFDLNAAHITEKDVIGVTGQMHKYGVTSYLPTVITGDFDRMKNAVGRIGCVCDEYRHVQLTIVGLHVEGPYLSDEDGPRGAHPKEHVRDPDNWEWELLQQASGNRIRMITVAPERKGMISFIKWLSSMGIVVCIGHTAASPEAIDAAVSAGAIISTHLGNGSHPMMPRHPNYIWDQLGDDRLWASFIPDGHHLAPKVLKSMIRAKRDRFVLVTDAVAIGGMPPGKYSTLVGGEVKVHENGRLSTLDNPNILAGSGVTMPECIANAIHYAGITLREAVEAVTARPAFILGRHDLGCLEVEMTANLTLFRTEAGGDITVLETILYGETVYKAPLLRKEGRR